MEFFDTHSHYQDEAFDNDRDEQLKKAYDEGITKILIPGWNIESSKKAIELSKAYKHVCVATGIHPSDTNEFSLVDELYELSRKEKVVAIGEIGLDYHYENIDIDLQKKLFIKQIEIANDVNLPIIIHTRDAVSDTLEIVKKYKCNNGGVLHCCPHNKELVKEALKLGYYIGIGGTCTFKNAQKNIVEVMQELPIDKILIETDSPYLSPEPFRGTRNDSIKVKKVAEKIAELKNVSIEEVVKVTYQNGTNLFGAYNV